jgi:CRISPR-associated protein Csx10
VRLDGFHRRWGLAQPTLPVIAAGSVLWLTSDTELSAAEVAELERRGVGLRTAEGFGRVRINPPELTIESYPDLASQPAPSGRRVEVEHLPRSPVDTDFARLNPKELMKQLGVPLSKAKVPLPGKLGELRAQLRRSGKGPGDHPACEWFKGSSSSRSKEARWGASLIPIEKLLNGRFGDQGSVWQLLNLQDPDSLSGDQWVSAVISVVDAVSRSRTRLEESSGKS